jgi:uncharacterized protein (DUF885 family)
MKRYTLTATALLLLILPFAQASPRAGYMATADSESQKLAALLDAYFEESLKLFPLQATSIGDRRYDNLLPDSISDEARAKQKALYAQYLAAVTKIDKKQLTGQDRLSYAIFQRDMRFNLEELELNTRLMPVNQFRSLSITFALLGSGKSNQSFQTVKDYENFLQRIDGFRSWADTAIVVMRKGMAAGVVPPRVLVEKTIKQHESMLVADVRESIFYQPVANMPAEFGAADRTRLAAAYTEAIRERVIPTYRKMRDFLRDEYLPVSRASAGLSAIPGGKDAYSFLVKSYTTTDLTPEEVHQIGLNEVRRIRAEMEKVKNQVGFKGDLRAFFEHLRTEPKLYPFTVDEEVTATFRTIESKIGPSLPKLFNLTPKGKFEVRLTEKFRAATSAAQYSRGTTDGSRPGVFYVPVVDAKKYPSFGMESLFLHEAIPGHHFQVALQQEQTSLPRYRQYGGYGAFIEGWALYAESLGKDLGLYTDPYQYFGRLQGEMHRAIRHVVDTGIHAKGWSREEAIKFMLENNSTAETQATSEIERYMAIPGQALSYKIGELKISEMRRKAEQTLGAKFDVRAFHDEVLKDGALPLDVFEAKMDEWLGRQAPARSSSGGRSAERGIKD